MLIAHSTPPSPRPDTLAFLRRYARQVRPQHEHTAASADAATPEQKQDNASDFTLYYIVSSQ